MSTEGQFSIPDYAFGGTGGAYLSNNVTDVDKLKIKDDNPVSNANLPGGIFTHPKAC